MHFLLHRDISGPSSRCFYGATVSLGFCITSLLKSASGCQVFDVFLQRNVLVCESEGLARMREPGTRLAFLPRETRP
jgi:hypothetical protein